MTMNFIEHLQQQASASPVLTSKQQIVFKD